MTADLRKNVTFWPFIFLHISYQNEQIFTLQVSCGQLVVVFIILKRFSESRINWIFSWPRALKKKSILSISHFCIFLIQTSKYLHLKCFQKVQKKWRSSWLRTCEKLSVLCISHVCIFLTQWTINISSILWSTGGDFIIFKGFQERRKKMKIFMSADLR